jgi:hypothetical protein
MPPRVDRLHWGTALMLVLAWGTMTTFAGVLFVGLPRRSLLLAGLEWSALYMATLVLPVVFTLRVRSRLRRLQSVHGPIPNEVAAELERAGWSYVVFGLFAAVTGVSLMVYYVR